MVKRKVSNPLALAVMSYLTTRPMHRYDLVRTLEANDDGRSVKFTPASVYMVVEQLEKAGFIEEKEKLRTGGYPERILYALTTEGRAECRDWLQSLISDPEHEYPHFVLALSLIGALEPDDAVRLLDERRRRAQDLQAKDRASMESALAGGLPPLFLVDEKYRLMLLDAELAFITGLISDITNPETGWARPWAAHLAQGRSPSTQAPSTAEERPDDRTH
ncbi:MAG TPA: PadR family transcriptional regulator [Galbitalea sp.]|nr:PadR family transcriptional regulator [Galbitalea sp.]